MLFVDSDYWRIVIGASLIAVDDLSVSYLIPRANASDLLNNFSLILFAGVLGLAGLFIAFMPVVRKIVALLMRRS